MTRLPTLFAVCVLLGLGPALRAQLTVRVSVNSSGGEANGPCTGAEVSWNGRYVAFESSSSNLVAGDTNGTVDVFVHDRATGMTERVSVSSTGVEVDRYTTLTSISEDGRYVCFDTYSSVLVPGDTNGTTDVFLHDRQTGVTERVSVGSGGLEGNQHSDQGQVADDGRLVFFTSYATNLVANDVNGATDVFVHDRSTGTTTLVSVATDGTPGNSGSGRPRVSADGWRVLFTSYSNNLVPGDTNNASDVFLRDRSSGVTTRVNRTSTGAEVDQHSTGRDFSEDGRVVVFTSGSTSVVPGDTNGKQDVFWRDVVTGEVRRMLNPTGEQFVRNAQDARLSGDGRWVGFDVGGGLLTKAHLHSIAAGVTQYLALTPGGRQGNGSSNETRMSQDGRFPVFNSWASDLIVGDTNNVIDVFLRGPELTLDIEPRVAATGDAITLACFRGAAGTPGILYLSEIDGTPVLFPVLSRLFDPSGLWSVAGTVPPGLSGSTLSYLVLGLAPVQGKPEVTNEVAVTFL